MVFLKISQNSQESTHARVSFLIKLQPEACNFIKKETLAQVFSCEFCEIFKNTIFIEHLWWLLLNLAPHEKSRAKYNLFRECGWYKAKPTQLLKKVKRKLKLYVPFFTITNGEFMECVHTVKLYKAVIYRARASKTVYFFLWFELFSQINLRITTTFTQFPIDRTRATYFKVNNEGH